MQQCNRNITFLEFLSYEGRKVKGSDMIREIKESELNLKSGL